MKTILEFINKGHIKTKLQKINAQTAKDILAKNEYCLIIYKGKITYDNYGGGWEYTDKYIFKVGDNNICAKYGYKYDSHSLCGQDIDGCWNEHGKNSLSNEVLKDFAGVSGLPADDPAADKYEGPVYKVEFTKSEYVTKYFTDSTNIYNLT